MKLSRRTFCSLLGASGLAWGTAAPLLARARAADASELRVIAYNILKCTGWPADAPLAQQVAKEKQMPRRMALELALYAPQIVTFSESPAEEVVQEIADYLGMNHVRFPSGGNWPGSLLTSFEIEDSQNVPLVEGERPDDLFTRHWGRATLRLPDGSPLVVHSAHLYPGAQATERRMREIEMMLATMQEDLAAKRSAILMGDLNHGPNTPEYAAWEAAGWVDTFAAVGKGEGLTVPASVPRIRIDYVWAAGPLAKSIKQSRPLFAGAFRTNPADDQSFALSDHLPQYAAFELGGIE